MDTVGNVVDGLIGYSLNVLNVIYLLDEGVGILDMKTNNCEICYNLVDFNLDNWCGDDEYLYHNNCVLQKFHREWRLILVD